MIKNLFNCEKCKAGIECAEHKFLKKKDGSGENNT